MAIKYFCDRCDVEIPSKFNGPHVFVKNVSDSLTNTKRLLRVGMEIRYMRDWENRITCLDCLKVDFDNFVLSVRKK